MKKVLLILGGIFGVLIVAACAMFGYMVYSGSRLDASSVKYVDAAIPAIVEPWSKDALVARAAPELLKSAPDEQLTAVFAKLSTLGALINYGGAKGESNVNMQLGVGTIKSERLATAKYIAHPQFENGPAEITVTLVQRGGEWQMTGFNVNSPFLRR